MVAVAGGGGGWRGFRWGFAVLARRIWGRRMIWEMGRPKWASAVRCFAGLVKEHGAAQQAAWGFTETHCRVPGCWPTTTDGQQKPVQIRWHATTLEP